MPKTAPHWKREREREGGRGWWKNGRSQPILCRLLYQGFSVGLIKAKCRKTHLVAVNYAKTTIEKKKQKPFECYNAFHLPDRGSPSPTAGDVLPCCLIAIKEIKKNNTHVHRHTTTTKKEEKRAWGWGSLWLQRGAERGESPFLPHPWASCLAGQD